MKQPTIIGKRYCDFRTEYNRFVDLLNEALKDQHPTLSADEARLLREISNHTQSIEIHARELLKKAASLGLIEFVRDTPGSGLGTRYASDALFVSKN